MKLRPYQQRASDEVFAKWQDSPSTLVVLPTGCGKTIVFADVVRRIFPRKALVLAHREELIFQAAEKIKATTGLHVDIEMGELRANADLFGGDAQVIVSTIQTQTAGVYRGGRMTRFDPADFGLVVIDEAHHATSKSYRRVMDYYLTNPDLKILGVTATPDRTDRKALGQVFDSVAYEYAVVDAVKDGWLVPIEQQMVEVESLDFSSVRTTAGDLNGADLAKVMEFEEALHGIAAPSLDIIGDRRAIVFCASVAQAERLSEILNRHRPGISGMVSGKTPKIDRRAMLSDFDSGKLQIVCNCGVLTEGFDSPGVEVVIMARPTKSRSLYAQMVGRATRPLPGVVDPQPAAEHRCAAIESSAKPSCLVVDFVGNAGRHKLVTTADILGGRYDDEIVEAAKLKARKEGAPMMITDALEAALAEAEQEKQEREAVESANRNRLRMKAKYRTSSADPFDVLSIAPPRQNATRVRIGKQLTPKQQQTLAKQGIDTEGMSYRESKAMLKELFRRFDANLCSFKQAKLLKKYGHSTEMTRQEAGKIIDGIAANGWRVPA